MEVRDWPPDDFEARARPTEHREYPISCGTIASSDHADWYARFAPTMEDFELPKADIFDLAGTLLDSVDNGRFGHYDTTQNRGISFREAAALQSFRDDYVFFLRTEFARSLG
jgi:site-specific DNA-cytosine methylase